MPSVLTAAGLSARELATIASPPFEQRHEDRLNVSPFFNGFEAQLLSQLATDFQGEEKPDVSRDWRGLCSAGYRQPCRNFACKDARRPALRRSGKGEFWLRATGSGSSPSASLHCCQMKTPSRGLTAASLPSFQVISPPYAYPLALVRDRDELVPVPTPLYGGGNPVERPDDESQSLIAVPSNWILAAVARTGTGPSLGAPGCPR